MANPEKSDSSRLSIEEFLEDPATDLESWWRLWEEDREFPIQSHRPGLLGSVVVKLKAFLRPFVKAPQADLWERQRHFNLAILDSLGEIRGRLDDLGRRLDTAHVAHQELLRDLREVRSDLLRDVQNNHGRISHLEAFKREGFADVMRHSDSLYSLMDQKLDAYRTDSKKLWARLGGLLARVEESEGGEAGRELARAWTEMEYLGLEARFRGTSEEIADRVESYLPYLKDGGPVMDLGCGRGETLEVLGEHGIAASGVDSSAEMIRQCRDKGLDAETKDLFAALEEADESSLAGIISLHVIEHLEGAALDRLIRLAWPALEPGGVLILETPNPLSLLVAARNFWRDPTHVRPVHPETLALMYEQAGFDPVERLELRPFDADATLPEIDLDGLSTDLRPLGEQINRIRDQLDDLLHGFQDYAVVGTKPA